MRQMHETAAEPGPALCIGPPVWRFHAGKPARRKRPLQAGDRLGITRRQSFGHWLHRRRSLVKGGGQHIGQCVIASRRPAGSVAKPCPLVKNRLEPYHLTLFQTPGKQALSHASEETAAFSHAVKLIHLPLAFTLLRLSIGLRKLNRFNDLKANLLFSRAVEPIWPCDVMSTLFHDGAAQQKKEIMMMPQPAQAAPSKPIPQDVLDRMESEWKQMQENNSRQPNQR